MISIGLMSGTSMDGIDAAVIDTDGFFHINEIASQSFSYDAHFKILLKAAEFSVRKAAGDLVNANLNFQESLKIFLKTELNIAEKYLAEKIKKLFFYFHQVENKMVSLENIIQRSTELHAKVVNQLLLKVQHHEVEVIGFHGQTFFHAPDKKITLQVGDAQHLANLTNKKVIHNFRIQDVLAGGQGAPFAPVYHHALAVRDDKIPLAIVNCGGIANITLISNAQIENVIGFDTGPGNGLIDRWIRLHSQGKESFDDNAKYGMQGRVHQSLIDLLYEKAVTSHGNHFFDCAPPKSLDIGDLNLIPELHHVSFVDACATLEAFTADSIVRSLENISVPIPNQWVLAGGGWNNLVIYSEFVNRLQKKYGTQVEILKAENIGWDGSALEAQIFAYLAVRSLKNLPISYPNITRVSEPLCGGYLKEPGY